MTVQQTMDAFEVQIAIDVMTSYAKCASTLIQELTNVHSVLLTPMTIITMDVNVTPNATLKQLPKLVMNATQFVLNVQDHHSSSARPV